MKKQRLTVINYYSILNKKNLSIFFNFQCMYYVCNCIFLGALGNDGWVTFSNLRRILDNLCELVKSQPTEEFTDVLVQALSGLTLMILRSSTTKSSEDSEKFTKTILKKTRGFFSYEKVNHHKEWIRRQVYYRFVVEVFKGIDHNKGQRNKAGCTLLTVSQSLDDDMYDLKIEFFFSQ